MQQPNHLPYDAVSSAMDSSGMQMRASSNVVVKPAVPPQSYSTRHDGYGTSGHDQAMSTRGTAATRHAYTDTQYQKLQALQQQAAAAAAPVTVGSAQASVPPPPQQQQHHQAHQQQQQQQQAASASHAETGPISPAQALKRYSEYLTSFEQSEVLQYPQVRQCGQGRWPPDARC